ncbi:hypothetical protein ND861_06285 [Leptospira sp. 2 VSF19]|uniref:Uncharacterized protein n=1 Tax=Leptospira soteropolitanensis TaxID=2950025 RepID=A0AAW5VM04_9LEPT|nr:hypothetical protein [Leptospira soteropolitanensis]MCW7492262.1 hypothetical protein [Leptospira soteropolitanensis]MCW7499844.1 hypothetical protein [Leptospira soteropolitanensis]MCW7522095.1 hypothetical protein [Leptospira soteropolitanensis]MCW7525949.1 hypothetical protein [Leptospira soteropolitanensis]MCW7529937.1 hypothetical protein [Leptospira soteropolitanensis]
MAKTKKTSQNSLFARIFAFFRSERRVNDKDAVTRKKEPKSFAIEWSIAIENWKKKLRTKQVSSGVVIEIPKFRLTKTNEKLFRAEGENYSLILITGNHLYRNKEDKWGGVLFVDEGVLNQNLTKDLASLDTLLSAFSIPKTDLFLDADAPKEDWRLVLTWERFWKEQIILQMKPNSMALVLLAIGEECREFFESVATERQKRLVRDELFYLNLGNGVEKNPYTKAKNLFGFGSALVEFGNTINTIKERREKEMNHGS